jgi:hypothetical protein
LPDNLLPIMSPLSKLLELHGEPEDLKFIKMRHFALVTCEKYHKRADYSTLLVKVNKLCKNIFSKIRM